MADNAPDSKSEPIPAIQKLFDRPFLWLFAGFMTMLIFYTLWGIVELVKMPQAPLP